MKGAGTGATVAAVCLAPLLLAGAALIGATGHEAAVSAQRCTPTRGPAPADEVSAALADQDIDGPAAEGLALPDEQIPHVVTLVEAGITAGVPARGQVIALATALQESRSRNPGHGDRDSLGLFQQRPSMGWGTAEEILDPAYTAHRFYEALLATAG